MPEPAMSLRRILFVEDDPDIHAIVEFTMARTGGFEIQTCRTGDEALRVAEGFAPDLILLDVMLPDIDGPSTLQALRRIPSLATTPAVFMTARVQPAEVAQYRALGALDVIAKPFEPTTLAETLGRLWRRHQEHVDV